MKSIAATSRSKILIVDDHALVRASIRRVLDEIPDMHVVGEAASGEEALTLIREMKPDVVVMDIKMPGIGGLGATRSIMRINPRMKILVVSSYDDALFSSKLIEAGAMGYITKASAPSEIVQAIRSLGEGQRYISAQIAQHLAFKNTFNTHKSLFDSLSEREFQIMLMIIHGASVQEISKKLFLSQKTINGYRYRIFEELSIENDVELVKLAIKHGLIDR